MRLQLSCHQINLFPWRLYQMATPPPPPTQGLPLSACSDHVNIVYHRKKAILSLLSDRGKTTGRLVLILVLCRHVGVN